MIDSGLSNLRKFIYRRRRLLGSISAALSVLFLFISLQSSPQSTPTSVSDSLPGLESGFVAVPVTLRSSAISTAVNVGDTIDLVTSGESGYPQVIAEDALVLKVPASDGFASQSSAVIVVAVAEGEGIGLAANNSADISYVITAR
jgi:hypothetical protein